jgi:hypothetical protein
MQSAFRDCEVSPTKPSEVCEYHRTELTEYHTAYKQYEEQQMYDIALFLRWHVHVFCHDWFLDEGHERWCEYLATKKLGIDLKWNCKHCHKKGHIGFKMTFEKCPWRKIDVCDDCEEIEDFMQLRFDLEEEKTGWGDPPLFMIGGWN